MVSSFGDDVALLEQGTSLIAATTTNHGPVLFSDGYYLGERPTSLSTSVALGRGQHMGDVVVAWTENGSAVMQAIPRLPATVAMCDGIGLPITTRIGTLSDANKVRISDCDADTNTITVVVRGSSTVEIRRMPCPAAPTVVTRAG